jgi:hypothetical protein
MPPPATRARFFPSPEEKCIDDWPTAPLGELALATVGQKNQPVA